MSVGQEEDSVWPLHVWPLATVHRKKTKRLLRVNRKEGANYMISSELATLHAQI